MFGWEHNVLTGEIVKVEYTAAQIKQMEKEGAEQQIKLEKEMSEAAAKAVKKQAVLDKLGLSAEEASLLLS